MWERRREFFFLIQNQYNNNNINDDGNNNSPSNAHVLDDWLHPRDRNESEMKIEGRKKERKKLLPIMVRCILSNVGYHEHGSDKNNNFTYRRARKQQKKVHKPI